MNHDTIMRDWQQRAEARAEENYQFLRSLKFRNYGFSPDKVAGKLHLEVFRTVDCTRCANCCKSMMVLLTDTDVRRIAQHCHLSAQEFTEQYLEVDEEEPGMMKVRSSPCPFLGDDDRCTIYEVRPAACREYPHTDKRGFVSRSIQHANNALECPAVFWIIEQLRVRARR